MPELIHNRSGIGSHAASVDLNKDGSRRNHHVDQAGHVHLLEPMDGRLALKDIC